MPVLFITTGLIGSGKSWISERISKKFKAKILSTDIARKEIFNIEMNEKKLEDYGQKVYSKKSREKVYVKLFEKAEKLLQQGLNVIIDASFQQQHYRDMAKNLADKTNSQFIILYCCTPENEIKKMLKERSQTQSVSDGRLEIFDDFKKNFDEVKIDKNVIVIDSFQDDITL
ncbi:hypothetical protein GMMP1_1600002 [Candidatus Magnetomoraceae bacterium gMMP-1]